MCINIIARYSHWNGQFCALRLASACAPVYLCMYVCMYVCMHVCKYVHEYLHWNSHSCALCLASDCAPAYMYACMHVRKCINILSRIYLCMHVRMCINTLLYTCMYVRMYTHMCIDMLARYSHLICIGRVDFAHVIWLLLVLLRKACLSALVTYEYIMP
jgi:hypothetical protein